MRTRHKQNFLLQSLLDFIKYNNSFPIILGALFLGAGITLAANQGAKPAIPLFSGTTVPETAPQPVDVTKLLQADINTYAANLQVLSVVQDSDTYFVKYEYQTLAVVDNAWQTLPKTGMLTVSKKMLAGRDLGLYAAEQLAQVVDQEIAYIKEVQRVVKDKLNPKTPTTSGEYAGLVGSKIDPQAKTFDGYNPVVANNAPTGAKTEEAAVSPTPPTDITIVETDAQTAQTILSQKEIQDMIVAAVARFLAVDTSLPADIGMETSAESEGLAPAVAPEEPESQGIIP